jgi:hypothetical protein
MASCNVTRGVPDSDEAELTAIPFTYPQVMAYLTSRRLSVSEVNEALALINVANLETEMILTFASRRGPRSDSCSAIGESKVRLLIITGQLQ